MRIVHEATLVMTNREISAFDGTNVFQVIFQPLRLRANPDGSVASAGPNTESGGNYSGSIVPLNSLPGCGPECDFIWFALLAGNALSGDEPRAFPTILGNEGEQPTGHFSDLHFRRRKDSKWIEEASWQFNESYVGKEPWLLHPEILSPENQREAVNYSTVVGGRASGMNRFRTTFRVELFAIQDGFEFPSRFRVERTSEATTTNVIGALYSRAAVVDSFSKVPWREDIRPELAGTVWVEDRRFRVRESKLVRNWIRYPIEDKKWILDTNDARLLAIAATRPAFAPPQDPASRVGWIARVIILAAILAPAGIFIYRRKRLPANQVIQNPTKSSFPQN